MTAVDLLYARRRRASLGQSQQLESRPAPNLRKFFEYDVSKQDYYEYGFAHPDGYDITPEHHSEDTHRDLAAAHGYDDQYDAMQDGLVRYWHMPVEAGLELHAKAAKTAIRHLQRRQPYGRVYVDVIGKRGTKSTEHDNWRQAVAHLRALQEQHAFHGTAKANIDAIRAVGLVPQVGDNTKDAEGHDVEAKVCLSPGQSTARSYAKKFDDGGVVLRVDMDHSTLAGACPQKDQYTSGAITVNQRIPPEAIRVVENFPTIPTPEEVANAAGYIQTEHRDHGRLGSSLRYVHPNGAQLILVKRQDLEHPISQNAGFEDRLKGVSGNWTMRWEHHSHDGVRSIGYNQAGLEHHLGLYHGRLE